ncbi:hypothetical protein [Luteibacter sp. dw_328]|uniref:hypothetical protein n=1 Tax=Luteibacter sp. dw_328 TaxID=2719796 RepID=UPI001BD66B54|nr:hypothetical protein [Luteibacter sp. dw_328]
MSRMIAIAALVLSMAVFAGQVFLFTNTDEQVICGVAGILVYGLAVAKATLPMLRSSRVVVVGWALVSGVILGMLPPRLRLGGAVDSFVLFFPLVHALALAGYFFLGRTSRLSDPRSAP